MYIVIKLNLLHIKLNTFSIIYRSMYCFRENFVSVVVWSLGTTHFELLEVPLELPLGVECGEGDVVVRERRAQDVQHVRPRREHQRLRRRVLGTDLDLMSFRGSFSLSSFSWWHRLQAWKCD